MFFEERVVFFEIVAICGMAFGGRIRLNHRMKRVPTGRFMEAEQRLVAERGQMLVA